MTQQAKKKKYISFVNNHPPLFPLFCISSEALSFSSPPTSSHSLSATSPTPPHSSKPAAKILKHPRTSSEGNESVEQATIDTRVFILLMSSALGTRRWKSRPKRNCRVVREGRFHISANTTRNRVTNNAATTTTIQKSIESRSRKDMENEEYTKGEFCFLFLFLINC
jgi:hypothetical protein